MIYPPSRVNDTLLPCGIGYRSYFPGPHTGWLRLPFPIGRVPQPSRARGPMFAVYNLTIRSYRCMHGLP